MQHAFVYILAQPPTACRNIIIRLVELVNACRCGVWSFVPFTISAEAVDTSSWPPAVGGNSHQPWVMCASGCTSRWRRAGRGLSAQPRETTVRMQSGPTKKRGFACRNGSGHCSYCCRASSYSSGSRVAVVAVAVAAVQL